MVFNLYITCIDKDLINENNINNEYSTVILSVDDIISFDDNSLNIFNKFYYQNKIDKIIVDYKQSQIYNELIKQPYNYKVKYLYS